MQRGTTNSLLAIEIGVGLRGGGGPPAAGARSWWLTGITQPDELGVGRGRRAAQGVVVVAPNFPFSTPTDIGFSGQPAPAAQRPGRGRGGGRGRLRAFIDAVRIT